MNSNRDSLCFNEQDTAFYAAQFIGPIPPVRQSEARGAAPLPRSLPLLVRGRGGGKLGEWLEKGQGL